MSRCHLRRNIFCHVRQGGNTSSKRDLLPYMHTLSKNKRRCVSSVLFLCRSILMDRFFFSVLVPSSWLNDSADSVQAVIWKPVGLVTYSPWDTFFSNCSPEHHFKNCCWNSPGFFRSSIWEGFCRGYGWRGRGVRLDGAYWENDSSRVRTEIFLWPPASAVMGIIPMTKGHVKVPPHGKIWTYHILENVALEGLTCFWMFVYQTL